MKPLTKGQETGLVEIPASWYIDDLPPMMFIKKAPVSLENLFSTEERNANQNVLKNSHGWVNPRDVMDIWKGKLKMIPI